MATKNSQLFKQTFEALSGNWLISIVAVVLISFIVAICLSVFFGGGFRAFLSLSSHKIAAGFIIFLAVVVCAIIWGIVSLGYASFFLTVVQKPHAHLSQIFNGFKRVLTASKTAILYWVNVLLYMLLLIVPGIKKALSYSMVFFILAEDKNIKPSEALRKSEELMNGYKTKLFWGLFAYSVVFFVISIILKTLPLLLDPAPYYYDYPYQSYYYGLNKTNIKFTDIVSLILTIIGTIFIQTYLASFYEDIKKSRADNPSTLTTENQTEINPQTD